ncbi:hypothetical protein SBA3_5050004 [Candidatus Sulfopaludibacter sp. SbA3]|nr:hypothetical protein SBA3_5050004 [Candidatus Sulfopaludibacter sp. SbA3]
MAWIKERWLRVEVLFHAALKLAPELRQAFLDVACGGDRDLRHQVEPLIAKDEKAGSFLQTATGNTSVTETAGLTLPGRQFGPYRLVSHLTLPGRQFGPYRLVSRLGAGGMGELYRAHDTKPGRNVTIQLCPPSLRATRND